MSQARNVSNCLSAIILILKLIGGYPVFPTNVSNRGYEKYQIAYTVGLLVVYSIVFGIMIMTNDDSTDINNFVNMTISAALLVTLTSIAITFVKNRGKAMEFLLRFDQIDQTMLSKLNIGINYKKIFLFATGITVGVSVVLIQSAISDYVILVMNYKIENSWKWVALFVPIFVTTYHHAFMSILAYLLYQRFSLMNECLKCICSHKWGKYLKSVPQMICVKAKNGGRNGSSFYSDMVKNVKIVNERLRNLANDICSSYSLPILTSSGTAFFVVTVQIYYLIILIRTPSPENLTTEQLRKTFTIRIEDKIKIGYCLTNLILIHILQFVLLVSSFHCVKEQVNKKKIVAI